MTCSIDKDAAHPGTPPAGAGTECLKTEVTSGTADCYIYKEPGEDVAISYVHGYLYLDAEGLGNDEYFATFQLVDSSNAACAFIKILQDHVGGLKWQFNYFTDGALYPDDSTTSICGIELDKWYRFEYLYDVTNNLWEVRVHDENEKLLKRLDGVLTGTTRTPDQLRVGIVGCTGSGTATLYSDLIQWQPDDWIGALTLGYDADMSWHNFGDYVRDWCGETPISGEYTLTDSLNNINTRWRHVADEDHFFTLDFGQDRQFWKLRARSGGTYDPLDVQVYLVTEAAGYPGITGITGGSVPGGWGTALYWDDIDDDKFDIDVTNWDYCTHTLATPATGRYLLVHIPDTEDASRSLLWGALGGDKTIFQLCIGRPATSHTVLTRTYHNPVVDTSDSDWTVWGGSGDHYTLLGKGVNDNNGVQANTTDTEYLEYNPIVLGAYIQAVRLWWRGQCYDSDNRNVRAACKIAGTLYSGKRNNVAHTGSMEMYYHLWEVNPADGQAWEAADLLGFIAGLKDAGNTPSCPGGKISELWLEVISGPNSTDAFLAQALGCHAVTDSTFKIWARTNQAAKVRIMFGTSEANVKSSTPSSLVGDTKITDDPGSNNAVSANDFCIAIDVVAETTGVSSLTAATTYYIDIYVNGVSAYDFEGAPYWNNLPSYKTAPTEGTWANTTIVAGGDHHSYLCNYRIHHNMAAEEPDLVLLLGDQTEADSVSLNDSAWDGSEGNREIYRIQRRGFNAEAKHLTEQIYKKFPVSSIYSDHDCGGDNADKSGHLPKFVINSGNQRGTDSTIRDGKASLSNGGATLTIDMTDDSYTYPFQVLMQILEEFVFLEFTNTDGGAYDGIYKASPTSKSGYAVTFTVAPSFGTTSSDFNCTIHIRKGQMPNCLQAFNEYNPEYTFSAPDDLTGTATGGGANYLIDTGTNFAALTGANKLFPGMVVHKNLNQSDYSFSYVKDLTGNNQVNFYQNLHHSETFGNGDSYLFQRGGIYRTFYWGQIKIVQIDVRYRRDESNWGYTGYGYDFMDGLRQYINPKTNAASTEAGTDIDTIVYSNAGTDTDDAGRNITAGDYIRVTVSSTDYHRLVASVSGTSIELSEAVSGLSGTNGTFSIWESGGSDHGSKAANEAAGHIQREWLIDQCNERESWVRWVLVVCEVPFCDKSAGFRDKIGDFDPLDAQRTYLADHIQERYLIWLSADRHMCALYNCTTLDGINPWPEVNASPLFCDFGNVGVPGAGHKAYADYQVRTGETSKFAGWGVDDESTKHTLGAYAVLEFTETQCTVTLKGPDGVTIDNSAMVMTGETNLGNLTMVVDIDAYPAWAIIKELSDNLGLTDAQTLMLARAVAVADGLGITDAVAWVRGVIRRFSEACGTTDNFQPASGMIRLFSDDGAISDAVRIVTDLVSRVSDGLGLSDSHTRTLAAFMLLADDVGTTDVATWLQEFTRRLSDACGATDDVQPASGMIRLFSDDEGASDTASFFKGIIKKISNDLGLSDAQSYLLTLVVALADSLGITDMRSTLTIMTRLLSDTMTPVDSSSEGGVDFVDTDVVFMDTDTIFQDTGYTSYVIPTMTFQRYQAEAQGLADSMLHTAEYFRDVSDNSGVSDALIDTLFLVIIKMLSDSLGVTDSRIAMRIMAHAISDNADMSDARVRVATYVQLLANIEGLTDLAATYADLDRKVSDAEGMADATTLFADLARLLSENQGITDNVVDILVTTMIERLLSDDAGISDATTDVLFAMFWQLLSDAEGATDQVSTIRSIIRLISDAGGIADGLTHQQDFIRGIKDAAGLTDAIKHVFTIAKRIADSIGLSDLALGNILAYALYKLILLGSQNYMQITPTVSELVAITMEPQELIGLTMTTFDSEVL